MGDQLPIGRIAFAKSICIDWISEHVKGFFVFLAAVVLLLFWLFQSTAASSTGRVDRFISPYYLKFSNVSALVNQGKWELALKESQVLREKMVGDTAFWDKQDKMIRSGGLLYAYNLIRLAALERKVGSTAGELTALEEFLKSSVQEPISPSSQLFDPEAYAMLGRAFQDGTISIIEYMETRKSELLSDSSK